MKFSLLFYTAILLFITSCGDDVVRTKSQDECTGASELLSGTILERPFLLKGARALYDTDEDEFQIQMFGNDEIDFTDVCNLQGTMLIGSQLTFFVDNELETRDFGGTKIVSLYHAASMEFLTTTTGCYSITSITDTTVEGVLTLKDAQGNDEVSGSWSAVICP